MSNKISMADFNAAKQAVSVINEVTASIKKIDFAMLGRCPVKAKKVSDFAGFLTKLAGEHEALILQGQQQYENRPMRLISAASSRMFEIPREIELEQKTAQSLINQHSTKTNELQRQGFNERQISEILPCSQAELDEHEANISNLKSEQRNLEQFLSDQLLCDINLLKVAKLEPFLQGQNQAN
jgi:hypothetical protein